MIIFRNKGFKGFCTALMILFYCLAAAANSLATTPVRILTENEAKNSDKKGEIYLGKVITIYYPPSGVEADEKYHPLILELIDLLKKPLRENYRVVLKGYSDSRGPALENLKLSAKRVEWLKDLFIKKYLMDREKITTKGLGEAEPVASNETEKGRALNRRVEVHIYGDVTEAVRSMEKQEEKR